MKTPKGKLYMLVLLLALSGLVSCRSLDCGCPMTKAEDRQLPQDMESVQSDLVVIFVVENVFVDRKV